MADYARLIENIADWLNDREDLKRVFPAFLSFAQKDLEDEVKAPDMSTNPSTTLYLAKGSNQIDIPSDYLELNYLCLTDQLPSPVNAVHAAGAGIIVAGTYYYRVSAINIYGETIPSVQTSITLGATGGVNVNWNKVTGATGYKVYGRTTGAQKLIATVGDVATYLDDGSVTPATAMPTTNTSGTVRYKPLDRYHDKKFAEHFTSIALSNAGRPMVITRVGNSFLFDKYADKDYAYEMTYFKRLPELSSSNPTNWWSLNAEAALLYGALMQAAPFLGDDPRVPTWEKAYTRALGKVDVAITAEARSGAKTAWGSPNVFFPK